MNRLVHAGVYRLIRNKIFIGCTLFSVGYCLFLYMVQYIRMNSIGTHYDFEPLLFSFLSIQGIVTAIFISLLSGTEFSDGTIRNKLIAGFSKESIYLSQFMTSIIAETLMLIAVYAIGTIFGLILFGAMEMSVGQFILIVITGVFVGVVYVAIFHLMTMLSGNKANAAILCILAAFAIIFISVGLYNSLGEPEWIENVKNTAYLSGRKRTVFQLILDLLPYGQVMQIANLYEVNHLRLIGYGVIESVVLSGVGAYLFSRKDIK